MDTPAYPADELQVVAADHYPQCRARIDQRFASIYCVNFIARGRVHFQIDQQTATILQGPCLFWHHPRHHYRYHPADASWTHWWVALSGSHARRLVEYGLMRLCPHGWLHLPQPEPARGCLADCLQYVHRREPRLLPRALCALDRIYQLANDTVLGDPATPLDDLDRAAALMRENPIADYDWDQLARMSGHSTSHFRRRFRQRFGHAPLDYLLNLRMQAAGTALRQGEESVATIAERFGYENASYFSKCFKRVMGLSPQDYRKGLPLAGTRG